MDLTSKALLHQVGKISGVVNVSVGEDHGMDLFRVERKSGIAPDHFPAAALEEAAVQQNVFPIYGEQVARACHSSGGTVKTDLQGGVPSSPDYARDLNPSEIWVQKKSRSSLI